MRNGTLVKALDPWFHFGYRTPEGNHNMLKSTAMAKRKTNNLELELRGILFRGAGA